jgi:Glycosyl hydrolases family 31
VAALICSSLMARRPLKSSSSIRPVQPDSLPCSNTSLLVTTNVDGMSLIYPLCQEAMVHSESLHGGNLSNADQRSRGYQNWTVLQSVVDTMREFNIPLENIWTDIDYMKEYRDFTNSPESFPVDQGQQFLQKLHAAGQHYIPIVDSAIYIPNPQNETDAYPTYNRGNDSGVFLSNPDGSQYIGAVWPGYTVFPDWHAEHAVDWWSGEMSTWHKDIAYDGIWIDMQVDKKKKTLSKLASLTPL